MAVSDSYQSAAFLADQFLVWEGLTVATATADQRADALTKLNLAYREVNRGVYTDEQGRDQHHTFSWLHLPNTADMDYAAAAFACDLPADFGGMIEEPVHQYSTTSPKAGVRLRYISPNDMYQRQRDATTSGVPTYYTVRAKTFAATDLSTYELVIDPPSDVAITVTIRYRQTPALLTDSVNVYPRGLSGIGDLILQCAKAREELFSGQVEGPESRRFARMFRAYVREDQEVIGDQDLQESLAEEDTGLSV